jgi:putative hydrolase of the HAD superfamily
MKIKAIIFDLDNTVFPVSSIGAELFEPIFSLISNAKEYEGDINAIKRDIMRKPFQKVAGEYQFSEKLTTDGINLLKSLSYHKPIRPFDDYEATRNIRCKKFLVTTGFVKMQESKIEQLGIEQDFENIYIVDPTLVNQNKKDIFKHILEQYALNAAEVLVIGDDPNSEILAAEELGINTVLYDKMNFNPEIKSVTRITNYEDLLKMINTN